MAYRSVVQVSCCIETGWCMLPSRRMPPLPPSPHSASSSELSPLYVPLSPVTRAERCKPCPVALVPTLGCFRSPPPSLLLLTCALSGSVIQGSVFILKSNRSLFSRIRLVIPQGKRHRLTHPQTLSCLDEHAPARWESAGLPLSAPMPTNPRRESCEKKVGPKSGQETTNASDTHSLALLNPVINIHNKLSSNLCSKYIIKNENTLQL